MSQSVIGVQTRFTTALRGPAKKWIITKNGSIVPKIVLNAPKRHRDICPTLFVRSGPVRRISRALIGDGFQHALTQAGRTF